MFSKGFLFLQQTNFQLSPFISKSSGKDSLWTIVVVLAIGAVFVFIFIMISKLRSGARGVKSIPPFNKDNFFDFAAKSGLSTAAANYLFRHITAHHNANPMQIFFNYSSMVKLFKTIYQEEKSWRKRDPVKFEEHISLLIDAITRLEEHFQSVSAVLNTYLIPLNTTVFLSDLNNHVRIKMSVGHSSPRTLVLHYRYSASSNDEVLRKSGRRMTLWLMDNSGGGYAAYDVKLKRIKRYSGDRKEYFLSHSWRREIPNITRKHKRAHFAQQGQLRLLSPPNKTAQGRGSMQINGLIMDISLGGCSILMNPRHQDLFCRNQKVMIRCNNPHMSTFHRSHEHHGIHDTRETYGRKHQPYSGERVYNLEGLITRVSNFSNSTHDGLCNVHVKFGKLERHTKNSLGLFIYGLENIRLRDSSSWNLG